MPKFRTKNGLFDLGPKILYLGIFRLEFRKPTVVFEISTIESLTHTVNFDIGSTFSKGPVSAFSEVPGPGAGRLYKICLSFPRAATFVEHFIILTDKIILNQGVRYQEIK